MVQKIAVSGVGCCLVDRLYNHISFDDESFSKYLSKERGDGGLTPGRLVFKEEFERFSGINFQSAMEAITKGKRPDKVNIGGPCIVALINAAQLLNGLGCTFRFYGSCGNDEDGNFLVSSLLNVPVNTVHFRQEGNVTPSTVVFSDPDFGNGIGERAFINSIGSSWDYYPEKLDNEFFASKVVVFGGTALVPPIHDQLTSLLSKAKSMGCLTVVNTVFDFRNEKIGPKGKWPLGESDDSYQYIDLLIADQEEALRLSGKSTVKDALQFFRNLGTGAVVVTNGAENIRLYADGKLFERVNETEMPVSQAIANELRKNHQGDTTGCGDNFAGGVIASIVHQLQQKKRLLGLKEACSWGIVSGGYSCFYLGGTYFEKQPGEKLGLIRPYYEKYQIQIHGGG